MTETRDLLIEIGTEEMPPKALQKLSQSFSGLLIKELEEDSLLEDESVVESYASPRRLALFISKVRECGPDRPREEKGPSVKVGLDENNNPTKPLIGFASKWGVEINQLERQETAKGEFFFYKHVASGSNLKTNLDSKIHSALRLLPIPKRMRWGGNENEFVRPVHWVVVLFGDETIDCEIMGIRSGNITYGHRYHHPAAIEIKSASDYVRVLQKAKVFLNGKEGQLNNEICKQVKKLASEINGIPLNSEPNSELVAEIAALVEWPVAIRGEFNPDFLQLPEEILIATLEDQQRYFPVRDKKSSELLPAFITIANIESSDEDLVRQGNERVIVPRLTDAMFFWNNDRKQKLDSRIPDLDDIIFQKKLGSIGDKSRRVEQLAIIISKKLGVDSQSAGRAAQLARCDLVTDLVGEFPELQGIIGKYLANNDGEKAEVARAIEEQYLPRFAGDQLPATVSGQVLALADKLDTLSGIFSIGQQPTGEKDPYALRRAALGVVRILVEISLSLSLTDLLDQAFCNHKESVKNAKPDLEKFIVDRARNYFIDKGFSANEVESVFCMRPERLDIAAAILEAVRNYNKLPEAASLSAANKRIGNILKKLDTIPDGFDKSLLAEDEEKILAEEYLRIVPEIDKLHEKQEFTSMLQQLAILKEPVDRFFDKVMVMTDDETQRNNRIGLLKELHTVMNRIADLSRLAA